MTTRGLPLEERLRLHVVYEPMSGCWLWDGYQDPQGYGRLKVAGVSRLAHRVSHELFIGPVVDDLTVDHLCLNKSCVSPWHLEAVTKAENNRRFGRSMTRCKQGHPFDASNSHVDGAGRRRCRACWRASSARYKARRRAER